MILRKFLGFAVVAGLMALAMPADRAQALSLANPASAATTQRAGDLTTAVHWRRYHHHRRWHRHRWHRHHGWHHRHHGWHRHHHHHRRWI